MSMRAATPRNAPERVYQLMLSVYPARFRAEYAHEMIVAFRTLRRASGGGLGFWIDVVRDVIPSAISLHLDAMRDASRTDNRIREGTMRPMAILAVMVGLIEVINALVEASAAASHGQLGSSIGGVIFVVLAGALLAASGIALFRRTPRSASLAQGAALVCLAVIVLLRVLQPWLSVFGTLLGIVFPIALLVFVRARRGPGQSMPTVA